MQATINKAIYDYCHSLASSKYMSIIYSGPAIVSISIQVDHWAKEAHKLSEDLTDEETETHFKNIRTVIDIETDERDGDIHLLVKIFDKDYITFRYIVRDQIEALSIIKVFMVVQKLG